MWKKLNSFKRICFVSCFVLLVFLWLFHIFFVFNTSPSFPPGVYLKTDKKPQYGDLVLMCPPDTPIFRDAMDIQILVAGFCASGTGKMIKRVASRKGDTVSITDEGVFVNGLHLKNSNRQILKSDSVLTVPFEQVVKDNEVLLMSENPESFDARYFGLLSEDVILSTVQYIHIF